MPRPQFNQPFPLEPRSRVTAVGPLSRVVLSALIFLTAQSTLATTAVADTIFVRSGATGTNTGATWADAFTDLQLALTAANPGDEIWVAAGTYTPAPRPIEPAQADRTASFFLRTGVALYGGFIGNETLRDQRDIDANPTLLSGDLMGDDAEDFENNNENSYHVVVALEVDSTAIIDGFVICQGRADGEALGASPESNEQGSGVNIYFASPVIRNCTIERNWSFNHGAINDHGDFTLVDSCTFRNNHSAGFGAGLYIHNHCQTLATNCLFEQNVAAAEGGGAYSRSEHGAMIEGCYFRDNRAHFGAGSYNAEGSATHIANCTFHGNFAVMGGGGVYTILSTVTVSNCIFAENTAGIDDKNGGAGSGGSGGGGFWASGGSPLVHDCIFTGNVASFGGGVYNNDFAESTVQDCVFIRNFAREAGGLYTLNSPVLVKRCTFTGNTARDGAFAVGGALSNYFSDAVVTECNFTGNSATLGGGALYNEGEDPVVTHCVFRFNDAIGQKNASQGWGGAILNGYYTNATIANCEMFRNTALGGGGIFNLVFSRPVITNCTITDNAASGDLAGGGIYSYTSTTPIIRNCIVWNNTPGQFAGIDPDVAHSCIEGGHAGAGNISINPAFIRPPAPGNDATWNTPDDDAGDLTPAPGSPCIDAGDNAATAIGEVDLAGRARRYDDAATPDTGVGLSPIVDMGALEFQGAACPADFNESGRVDSQDFFDFLTAFFALEADFNSDGLVDSQDFFDFLAAFFVGCN